MNTVILSGRLTADPEVRTGSGEGATSTARYTLAVDKGYRVREGEPTADFLRCVTFGKAAEFAEKYLHKGMKIIVRGRINTGSYTNDAGVKVYTTDIVVDSHEFCESKNAQTAETATAQTAGTPDFMSVPTGIESEALPWA